MSEPASRPLPRPAMALIGLVGSLGFVALMGSLVAECGAGGDTIEAYAATIRGGASVTPDVGGPEAQALTDALRGSRSVTVLNFLSQSGTSCYSTRLSGDHGSTSADFLLKDGDAGPRVIGATLTRDCTCPDEVDARCRIE